MGGGGGGGWAARDVGEGAGGDGVGDALFGEGFEGGYGADAEGAGGRFEAFFEEAATLFAVLFFGCGVFGDGVFERFVASAGEAEAGGGGRPTGEPEVDGCAGGGLFGPEGLVGVLEHTVGGVDLGFGAGPRSAEGVFAG